MGFYVSVRGDKHALSAKQVADHPMNPEARTAIIMPICNEDVATVFAGLRATCESVAATGHAQQFDVFVLSDSYTPETAAAERAAWEDLRAALAAQPEPAAGRGVLPPAHPPHAPQGRQRGRLLPPLGQGLPLHGGARCRQRDERRLPDRDGQADGSQPHRRHHPDRDAGHRPRHAARPRPAVRLAHDGPPVHARHAVLAARRVALLGPQRDHPRRALHGALRAGARSRAPAACRAASCRTTSSKPR